MQSQNHNGENPLREILDDVRREYHVAPHGETSPVGEGDAPTFVFELEEGASPKPAPQTHPDDFSFIDHLSSREIYQMPTGEVDSVWSTYVPRFSDTIPPATSPSSVSISQEGEKEPVQNAEMPEPPSSESAPALQIISEEPKARGHRVITPIDHSEILPEEDRIPVTPVREIRQGTQISATTPEISPSLSASPTAEEDLRMAGGEVTVVEIGQGSEEGEDVFVLPKQMQMRDGQDVRERTEEDELRDIIDTISPLSDITAPEAPAPEAVVAEEVCTPVQEEVAQEPIAAEESIEEVSAEAPEVPMLPDEPSETLTDPADIYAHVQSSYDMPEASEAPEDTPFSAEFTSYTQQPAFKDGFLDKILSVKVRFACAGLLTLALFALAMLPVFGIHLVEQFSLYNLPSVLALIDMQGVVCLLVLAFPELIRAYRDIFKGRVRSEFFLFVNFVFMLLYTIFVVVLKPLEYPLFGSLFGVFTCISILSSHYMHKAQFLSFRLLSIPEEKMVTLATPTRTLVHENFALDGVIDEYKSKCARTFRSSFIDGFFAKNKKTSENSVKILTNVCISILSSLVVAIIAFILKDMRAALYAFMSVLCFSSPAFFILSHKRAFFEAERLGLSDDATIIGEGTFEEYAAVDVVTYMDTEIFGVEDVALRRFKLIGDEKDFTKPLRQMAALFGAVGGPLATLFDNALERHCEPSEDVIIETDGIYGTVEGVEVFAGSEEFMYRHGIEIPADETASSLESAPTTKVLYSAQGNRVHAKFYIRYSFSEEFTMLLPSLREAGITPLIYTRDPNITADLLKALTLGGAKVRVMKKYNSKEEDNPLYPRLSGGIVTLGEKTGVLNMIFLCKRYRKFISANEKLQTAATIIGALLGGALSLLFTPTLPVFAYALWHGAWITLSGILTHLTFRIPKNTQKEK